MKLFVMRFFPVSWDSSIAAYISKQLRPLGRWVFASLITGLHAALQAAVVVPDPAIAQPAGMFIREVLIVTLLAACAWVAIYIFRYRKRQGRKFDDSLHIVTATALGPRERAVVLRANGRSFLLGVTANQVSLLAEFEEPEQATAPLTDQSISNV